METNYSKPLKFYRALDRGKAKHLEYDRMTDTKLWQALDRELELAVNHGENWDTRQAFYAAVRAQAIMHELYLRGEQLRFFAADEFALKAKVASAVSGPIE